MHTTAPSQSTSTAVARSSLLEVDEGEPTFNLRLIEAVKQSRCLYDSTDRQYRNLDYKNKVWNRLAQILAYEGDNKGLYNRWKQLRDKYAKEKKRCKVAANSSWQYFRYLTFLDSHISAREGCRTAVVMTKTGDREVIDMSYYITDPHFNATLIEEVKRHPCLFDMRDPKYRHTECRSTAWTEIIRDMDFPGDIQMIYKQWKKLRDRYVREKKRLRLLGPGESDVVSTWDLYSSMTWMDPYLDERPSCVFQLRL